MSLRKTLELYVLEPIERFPFDPWEVDGATERLVVRAASPRAARQLAADSAGPEGAGAWLDAELSACHRLGEDGEQGVVCREVVG